MDIELESWRKACIALVAVSILVGLLQRSYRILDTWFEVAIFHVPAVVALVVYYSLRRRASGRG